MNPERLWVSINSSSYNSLLISLDAVCARKPIVLETSVRDSSPQRRRHCITKFALYNQICVLQIFHVSFNW